MYTNFLMDIFNREPMTYCCTDIANIANDIISKFLIDEGEIFAGRAKIYSRELNNNNNKLKRSDLLTLKERF